MATMDVSKLRTHEEMMHAVWVLDLANQCIRIVLADFRGDPATDHLVLLAEKLIASIEQVRRALTSLRSAFDDVAAVGVR